MNKILKVIGLSSSLTEQEGMESFSRLIQELAPPNFRLKHISTWDSSHKGVQNIFHFLRACFTFLQLILKREVDLAHIHFSERESIVRKILIGSVAYPAGVPVVLHAHGCEFHVFYSKAPKLLRRVMDAFFKRSSLLIVSSESWKEFYVDNCKLPPDRVIVLQNPVVFPRLIPLRPAAALRKDRCVKFLFMGKINDRKGVYDLVHAIFMMNAQDKEKTKVLFVGSGEIEQLKHFADDLEVLDQLDFLDRVNAEMRDRLLAESDVFVLPSYNEGLPMTLLEAVSWGLPVITTAVGDVPEIITSNVNGFLLQPGDVAGLSKVMSSLINNEDLRFDLGSRARNGVILLDIESYSKNLFNLYEKIAGKA